MTDIVSYSIVIPLYNKAAQIASTIRSVLAQSVPASEIIVVDDGSTDDGAEVVSRLALPQVRLIRQPNGGVARARNTGIANATREWVVFLDADDWQHPRFLEALTQLIQRYPQADAVATQYRSVSAERFDQLEIWPVDMSAPTELIFDLPRYWQQGATFFTSSMAVRRSRLEMMTPCFPPGENFGEDMDLWFRLAELGPIALHSAPLIARVWTPGGLSSVHHATKTEAPFLLRMEARAGTLPPAMASSIGAFVDHHRVTLARDSIGAGQRLLALQLLWRARRHWMSKRWLLTTSMGLVLPGTWVFRWQLWRKRRKMVLG